MWRCKKCNTENPDSLKECEKCGSRQSGSASPTSASTPLYKPTKSATPEQYTLALRKYQDLYRRTNPPKEYSVLAVLSTILNVVGVLSLLCGIILGIMLGNADYEFNFWIFLMYTIIGAAGLVVSLAAAQLIHLFIDMGNNSYETSMNTYVTACIQADQMTKSE